MSRPERRSRSACAEGLLPDGRPPPEERTLVIYRKSKYYTEEPGQYSLPGVSPLLSRALSARGAVTPEQIERFLHPSPADFHDPFLLPDMDKAVARIRLALETKEKICVFGDYDVDGICSTAMLTDYFRSVGADIVYHIPSRSEEGYGMSAAAVEKLYKQGVGLIITVDNGISAAEEIRRCSELGVDVIVTDHHIPPETMPDCAAVVCHTVPGSRYPNSILCGAGTAFKLLQALAGLDAAMKYISLAGLASVADVVPLLGENRTFVKLGLAAVNEGRCCPGLTRLLESIPTAKKPYNACNLGFAVAPRLNASGRMSDASLSVELFLTDSIERMDGIIAELNRLNELRQQDEVGILNDVLGMLSGCDLSDTRAIVLMKKDWNGGVIGIAASRILEMFHRPTILFCEVNGVLKGSARSIDGVNIHDALSSLQDCFIRFGGHAKAAGVTMDEARFDEFREKLNAYLRSAFPDSAFSASKDYEFEIPLEMVSGDLIAEFSMLAPFGECNPSPVFRSRGVEISRLRRFGNDAQHTRMEARSGQSCLEAVWFCSGPYFKSLLSAEKVDVLYTPTINKWCGNEGIQLRIKWAQAEYPTDAEAFIENGMWNFCDALVENSGQTAEPSADESIPFADSSLAEIFSSRISGILALAFSPEGAKRAVADITSSRLNVSICFGCAADSPVCDNSLLIAPKLGTLPPAGYSLVVFCDEPPFPGSIAAIKAALPGAEFRRLRTVGIFGGARDFSEVALRFSCDRDFMGDCYHQTMQLLSAGDISFEELTVRVAERGRTAKYCARFALRVFMEVGFIGFNERGSVSIGTIRPTKLTESRLFSAVLDMRSKLINPSRR